MNKPHAHIYSAEINKWIAGTLKLPTYLRPRSPHGAKVMLQISQCFGVVLSTLDDLGWQQLVTIHNAQYLALLNIKNIPLQENRSIITWPFCRWNGKLLVNVKSLTSKCLVITAHVNALRWTVKDWTRKIRTGLKPNFGFNFCLKPWFHAKIKLF